MRFVITGALGHIGSRLLRAVPQQFGDADVVLVDDLSTQRYCSLFDLPGGANYQFLEADETLRQKALDVLADADRYHWVHQTNWFGEPALNLPQDMFALQEAVYCSRPKFIDYQRNGLFLVLLDPLHNRPAELVGANEPARPTKRGVRVERKVRRDGCNDGVLGNVVENTDPLLLKSSQIFGRRQRLKL